MRFALCQINPVVGDVAGNTERILARATALAGAADVLVFPELAVPGYPPTDHVLRGDFRAAVAAANERLVAAAPATIIFGTLLPPDGGGAVRWANGAIVARGGAVLAEARKALLPTYDVFDEARFFEPLQGPVCCVDLDGLRLGLAICEDFWRTDDTGDVRYYPRDPAAELAAAGADVLLNLSASPWCRGKVGARARFVGDAARRTGLPLLYCNMVGGNDDLLFDGRSLAWAGGSGAEIARAAAWAEDVLTLEVAPPAIRPVDPPILDHIEEDSADDVARALVLGVRDFCRKVGVPRAIIGLSGGIDSSVTAAIAALALGPQAVTGVALPSAFTSDASNDDARALAEALGIAFEVVPIGPVVDALSAALEAGTGAAPTGVTHENLQARARGTLLMALANRHDALVLTTGNKAELATGYCTLYGDMVGALGVLGDLLKAEVYAVGRACDRRLGRQAIPERVYTRAPTAELRPDQRDEDSLPPYDDLDDFVARYLIDQAEPAAAARGFDGGAWARRLEINEFKREQAPPILRVSPKAFGRGRRMAVAKRLP